MNRVEYCRALSLSDLHSFKECVEKELENLHYLRRYAGRGRKRDEMALIGWNMCIFDELQRRSVSQTRSGESNGQI